jgi:hypothetical protein
MSGVLMRRCNEKNEVERLSGASLTLYLKDAEFPILIDVGPSADVADDAGFQAVRDGQSSELIWRA